MSSPSPAATECHPREKREILESGVGAGVLGIAPGEAGRKAAELIERLHRVRQPKQWRTESQDNIRPTTIQWVDMEIKCGNDGGMEALLSNNGCCDTNYGAQER